MAKWYDGYLESDHWQRTRLMRLIRAQINDEWNLIRCDRTECGLYVPLMCLDVHHKTYERLGEERMEDLAVLCRSCHGVVHGYAPRLWWERAKKAGRQALFAPSINLDRNIKRIGDVVVQCLAHCEERQGSRLIAGSHPSLRPQRERQANP